MHGFAGDEHKQQLAAGIRRKRHAHGVLQRRERAIHHGDLPLREQAAGAGEIVHERPPLRMRFEPAVGRELIHLFHCIEQILAHHGHAVGKVHARRHARGQQRRERGIGSQRIVGLVHILARGRNRNVRKLRKRRGAGQPRGERARLAQLVFKLLQTAVQHRLADLHALFGDHVQVQPVQRHVHAHQHEQKQQIKQQAAQKHASPHRSSPPAVSSYRRLFYHRMNFCVNQKGRKFGFSAHISSSRIFSPSNLSEFHCI